MANSSRFVVLYTLCAAPFWPLLPGEAAAQNWGSMSYNCYHYLTGDPVSCSDSAPSQPVEEIIDWQPPPAQQQPVYNAPPPPPPKPVKTNWEIQQEHKQDLWRSAVSYFEIEKYDDALEDFLRAENLCLQWDLGECDVLRRNIDITRGRQHSLQMRNLALNLVSRAYKSMDLDYLQDAINDFRKAYAICEAENVECDHLQEIVVGLSARLLVKEVVRYAESNPILAYANMDMANNVIFDRYFGCDEPDSSRCLNLAELYVSSNAYLDQQGTVLRNALKDEAASRLDGNYTSPWNEDSPFKSGSSSDKARFYLELLALPDQEAFDFVYTSRIEDLTQQQKDYLLLQHPMASLVDSISGVIAGLFEEDWWSDISASWNTAVASLSEEEDGPELTPTDGMDANQIESAALVFVGDTILQDRSPNKTDLMLAALHAVNVLEKRMNDAGYSVSAVQKWEASGLFLHAVFLEDTTNDLPLEALHALNNIYRLSRTD